jgi:hypothetical protein
LKQTVLPDTVSRPSFDKMELGKGAGEGVRGAKTGKHSYKPCGVLDCGDCIGIVCGVGDRKSVV